MPDEDYIVPSPSRRRFIERKNAVKARRARDKHDAEHSFFCFALRESNTGPKVCNWQVKFRYKTENSKATCRRCKTVFIYARSSSDWKLRWMTMAQHAETFIPEESTIKVEDVYKEITREKRTDGPRRRRR